MRYFFICKRELLFLACCILILVVCFISMYLPTEADADIYEKVVRLHVIANSDTEQDQTLKLMLRDTIIDKYRDILSSCKDKEEASKTLGLMIEDMREYSENYVREQGYDYNVEVYFGQEHYERTEYENFIMPSGDYLSLRVVIGEGEGKNWWCILFPPLCTQAAMNNVYEDDYEGAFIEAGFTGEQYRIITESDNRRYRIKFRILEILFGE